MADHSLVARMSRVGGASDRKAPARSSAARNAAAAPAADESQSVDESLEFDGEISNAEDSYSESSVPNGGGAAAEDSGYDSEDGDIRWIREFFGQLDAANHNNISNSSIASNGVDYAARASVSENAIARLKQVKRIIRRNLIAGPQPKSGIILDPYDSFHITLALFMEFKRLAREWEGGGVFMKRVEAPKEARQVCRVQSSRPRYFLFVARTREMLRQLVRKFREEPGNLLVRRALAATRTVARVDDQQITKRLPWSEAETQALKVGFARYCAQCGDQVKKPWASITSDPEFEQIFAARSTVDLKDRWRVLQRQEEKEKAGAKPKPVTPRRARLEYTEEEEAAFFVGYHRYRHMKTGTFKAMKEDPELSTLLVERSVDDLRCKRRSMVRNGKL